jgi:probable HAF family extracellular repeat protein
MKPQSACFSLNLGGMTVTVLLLMLVSMTACTQLASPQTAEVTARAAVQVTDLGTLSGGTYSSASAINNLGQVAGMSNDATLSGNKQVIWSAGSISQITACCGGGQATPRTINDSREVVGWENGGYATNGIYWDASGMAFVLPALPGGENRVFAYDINNSGTIVGQSRDASLDRHAVVWNRTTFVRDLGFMGAASPGLANFSGARGINDGGDIVGQAVVGSDYHAFMWRNGSFTDLGLGSAFDINNNGLIAGWTSGQVPVVWRNGVMENLPGLSGEAVGYGHIVTGLNNNGDVVGYAPSPVGIGFQYTAVLWRGGKAINLGFYPGGTNSIAYDINDSGQIVGEGSIVPNGPMHALIWTVGSAPVTNATPVVSLTATSSITIRPGGSVSFKGSFTDPDGGPWSYSFNWGNGSTSGTVTNPGVINANRSYTSSGRYRVGLTVTDAKGATGKSGTIEVRVR